MEQWEKDLRERLDKEIPNGMYDLSAPGMVCYGGKGAKINLEVAFRKAAAEYVDSDICAKCGTLLLEKRSPCPIDNKIYCAKCVKGD